MRVPAPVAGTERTLEGSRGFAAGKMARGVREGTPLGSRDAVVLQDGAARDRLRVAHGGVLERQEARRSRGAGQHRQREGGVAQALLRARAQRGAAVRLRPGQRRVHRAERPAHLSPPSPTPVSLCETNAASERFANLSEAERAGASLTRGRGRNSVWTGIAPSAARRTSWRASPAPRGAALSTSAAASSSTSR